MSTYVTPKNLSRRAQELLTCALRVTDENGAVWPTGTPASALTTLTNVMRKDARNVRTALRELEGQGLAHSYLFIVKGQPGRGGLRVVLNVSGTSWVPGLCATCGASTKGTGRWCASHKQTEGRHDREWQVAAKVLLEAGHTPLNIANWLRRPYMVASNADGRSANGGAVVPFLLGQGLLGLEWAEMLRDAVRGSEEEA